MNKILNILVVLLLLLTSCTKQEETLKQDKVIKSFDIENYNILLPYDYNSSRYWYTNTLAKSDSIQMPKSLQEYSKEYFDPKDNLLVPGRQLNYDDIQMLQRRNSSTYPYALNPEDKDYSINPTTIIESPYIVNGLYELNYISTKDNKTISGISVAILINDKYVLKKDDQEYKNTISNIDLLQYSKEISSRLEDYIRVVKEVDYNIPIFVGTYISSDTNSYIPGYFISKSYFHKDTVNTNDINEKWFLFPSDELKEVDSKLYNDYISIKNQIDEFIPENISMIGQARYDNDYIQSINLDIRLQSKSYNEIYSFAQYVKNLVQIFNDKDYNITIDIKQFEETSFVLSKKKNENKFILIDMN